MTTISTPVLAPNEAWRPMPDGRIVFRDGSYTYGWTPHTPRFQPPTDLAQQAAADQREYLEDLFELVAPSVTA